MFCPGYVVAWFTNLHEFRERSFVERIFWSIPLSFGVTTIALVLVGKALSMAAVIGFLQATTILCTAVLAWEGLQLHRSGRKWNVGWHPMGGIATVLAAVWIFVVVFSLVDLHSDHKLMMNVAMLDQSYRVNWTEAVLRTGVPPANPLYWYKHSADMRNYYFWYVTCAAVARMAHLPARAVIVAGSVWTGFLLAALNGLYLKHFLDAGIRLRKQFLRSIFLLCVTGLDICVALWVIFLFHSPPLRT